MVRKYIYSVQIVKLCEPHLFNIRQTVMKMMEDNTKNGITYDLPADTLRYRAMIPQKIAALKEIAEGTRLK